MFCFSVVIVILLAHTYDSFIFLLLLLCQDAIDAIDAIDVIDAIDDHDDDDDDGDGDVANDDVDDVLMNIASQDYTHTVHVKKKNTHMTYIPKRMGTSQPICSGFHVSYAAKVLK